MSAPADGGQPASVVMAAHAVTFVPDGTAAGGTVGVQVPVPDPAGGDQQ